MTLFRLPDRFALEDNPAVGSYDCQCPIVQLHHLLLKRQGLKCSAEICIIIIFGDCPESSLLKRMSLEEQNKALIQIGSLEIGSKGNLEKIPELFKEDFVSNFLPTGSQTAGTAEYMIEMARRRRAFPDWTEEIKLMIAENDLVASWYICTGTNTGALNDHLPTGHRFEMNAMSIHRIVDGKIKEQWLLPDLQSLQSQLGFTLEGEKGKTNREGTIRIHTVNFDGNADSVQSSKALALKANEEIWNRGNFETLEQMFAGDFVQHLLPFDSHTVGLDEFRRNSIAHREAFPDWAEVVNLIVAEEEFVALEYTSTGTNTGNFLNKPPTAKAIRISEMTIFRIEKGKIAEQWLLPDILSLNQQLGLIPDGNQAE